MEDVFLLFGLISFMATVFFIATDLKAYAIHVSVFFFYVLLISFSVLSDFKQGMALGVLIPIHILVFFIHVLYLVYKKIQSLPLI